MTTIAKLNATPYKQDTHLPVIIKYLLPVHHMHCPLHWRLILGEIRVALGLPKVKKLNNGNLGFDIIAHRVDIILCYSLVICL